MSQRKRTASGGTSDRPDDFQNIKGIGPVLTQQLHDAGISTYRDLAAVTPARIADILAQVSGMSAERVAAQDWIGQARRLAVDASDVADAHPDDPDGHQRYTTFNVELLVGADGAIRRTRVLHYQSDTAESWPGWAPDQLVEFLHGRQSIDVSPEVGPAELLPPSPIGVESLGPIIEGSHPNFTFDSEPTNVQLVLVIDPDDGLDAETTTDFTASVVARTVGGSGRHAVGTTVSTVAIGERLSIEMSGPPLPPGLYFLEADLAVYVANHSPDDEPLFRRRVPGELIHVSKSRLHSCHSTPYAGAR